MRVYLITDDTGRSPAELTEIIAAAIAGGVTAVQFREKNCGPTSCAIAFESISRICADSEVPLFLNADLIGRFTINGPFTGYQYSNRTLPALQGPIAQTHGYSAHDIEDARSAFYNGVHFCTLSPVFETPSKRGILDEIGLDTITATREALPDKPIIGLGGINESNASSCIKAGATGIAVIRAVMNADDPEAAARRLRQIVENSIVT